MGSPMGPHGYYDGGAKVPYKAGMMSPCGLIPFYVDASASWMPFDWGPYGEYCYLLNHSAPAPDTNTNDPILCACGKYLLCGCDNTEGAYVIPPSVRYSVINGTEYAIVNGTLENGTAPFIAQSSGINIGGYPVLSAWALLICALNTLLLIPAI